MFLNLDTSIKGLFESLFNHTIILDGNSKEVLLKDVVHKDMQRILSYNFIRVTQGFSFLNPIAGAYTSLDTKRYTGEFLPEIWLPTNQTQLFAAGIMCAVGLAMEQLSMSEEDLHNHAIGFSKTDIKYLIENEFDENHAWLSDLYYGIRSIEWGTSEDNVAFYKLID
jgi:hypothetical protein